MYSHLIHIVSLLSSHPSSLLYLLSSSLHYIPSIFCPHPFSFFLFYFFFFRPSPLSLNTLLPYYISYLILLLPATSILRFPPHPPFFHSLPPTPTHHYHHSIFLSHFFYHILYLSFFYHFHPLSSTLFPFIAHSLSSFYTASSSSPLHILLRYCIPHLLCTNITLLSSRSSFLLQSFSFLPSHHLQQRLLHHLFVPTQHRWLGSGGQTSGWGVEVMVTGVAGRWYAKGEATAPLQHTQRPYMLSAPVWPCLAPSRLASPRLPGPAPPSRNDAIPYTFLSPLLPLLSFASGVLEL